MAKQLAAQGSVKIGANEIAELKGYSISQGANTIDQSTLKSQWKEIAPGMKNFSIKLDVFWDPADTTGQGALAAGAEVTFSIYPEGEVSGDTYWTGAAVVTSIENSGAIDGMVEASFSADGNGALTEAAVI